MSIVVDTGGLVALGDRRDRFHSWFRRFFTVDARLQPLILPVTILPEVDHLVTQRVDHRAAIRLVELVVQSDMHVEMLQQVDFPRIVELMRQYADNGIGFVDASVVAVAERLNVRTVLTLDRRHFGAIRPRHCATLEILP